MTAQKQLLLFHRPVKPRPLAHATVWTCKPAPADRSWLKSFVSPAVWALIAEPPVIKHSARKPSK